MRSQRTRNFYRGRRYQRARRLTLARAGRRCERCGAGGKLQVHHVKPLAQGGPPFDLDNLMALCPPCHRAAHDSTPGP